MSARLRRVEEPMSWEHDDERTEVLCFSRRALMSPDRSSSGQQLLVDQTRKALGLREVRGLWDGYTVPGPLYTKPEVSRVLECHGQPPPPEQLIPV
jgi:hypothetical protein